MPIEDDDRPRKKISHEIGQDLSLLSVEELTERVALLKTEIARLEEAATKKRASRDAANSFQVVGFSRLSCLGRGAARSDAPQSRDPCHSQNYRVPSFRGGAQRRARNP